MSKELYAKDLARSGLTPADGKQLGMTLLSAMQTTKAGHAYAVPSIQFAYYDPFIDDWIDPHIFHRVRYLEQPSGWLAATKPVRYSQPAGSMNDLYIPRFMKGKAYDWESHFKDARQVLFITEGEKKSAIACKLGLPCVALGGVSMWSANVRGARELRMLEKIEFKNRSVYVVFDSDSADGLKPDVMAAAKKLMEHLLARGAIPGLVVLPAGAGKIGLDDYLIANGVDKFVDEIVPQFEVNYTDASILCNAAMQVAYIESMDRFVQWSVNTEAGPMKVEHLNRVLELKEVSLPRLERVKVQGGGYVVRALPKVLSLADALLIWPGGERFTTAVYRPGRPRVIEEHGRRLMNLWNGWRAEYETADKLPDSNTRARIMREWNWVLDNVFGDDAVAREFIEHWLYYPIKYPGTKLNTFTLVCSRSQGIGKSFIGHMVAKHVYGLTRPGARHAYQLAEGDLHGQFNPYLNATSFVEGDDIASSDKKNVYERIKSFVTSDTVMINMKNVPQFMLENCANFWLTSNDLAAFFMGHSDRRPFVHVPRMATRDPERFHRLQLDFDAGLAGPTLLWHAREKYDEKNFAPHGDAPQTMGLKEVAMNSQNSMREWCQILFENPGSISRPFATPKELYGLFLQETINGDKYSVDAFGHAIRETGAQRWGNGAQLTIHDKRERVWCMNANSLKLQQAVIIRQIQSTPFKRLVEKNSQKPMIVKNRNRTGRTG